MKLSQQCDPENTYKAYVITYILYTVINALRLQIHMSILYSEIIFVDGLCIKQFWNTSLNPYRKCSYLSASFNIP